MIAASATWTRTAVLALCALSAAAFQFPATLLHTRCVLRATVPNQAVDRLPLLRHAPRPARGLALRATGGGQDAADGDEEKGGGEYDMEAFREMMQGSWDKEQSQAEEGEFDGYQLRALIEGKFGAPYDLQLQRHMFLGKPLLFINVMWKHLGQVSFHLTEQEYMENLQAIAELCIKWERVDLVKELIAKNRKYPQAYYGYAVSLALDLPWEVMKEMETPSTDPSE
ncbi:hypothetical protein T484DRAFT_1959887 [Baffinella frigidus]|nr:hypothetical protein T484DRAFT_1959887 [Cryptophyta sp. CCMP2293]